MPRLPEHLALDFDPPLDPVPFAPRSHTSYVSALTLARSGTRGRKTRAYLLALALAAAGHDGLTDPEAARALAQRLALPRGIPVQSICSIRNACRAALLVERGAIVMGPWGKPNACWRLTTAGARAAQGLVT